MRPLLLCLLALVACGPAAEPAPEPVLPDADLVVVLLDAAAAGHFGFLGYDRPTTPRLDEIAQESVVFETAYSQSTGTSLSVFSFMTSIYPALTQEPHPRMNADEPVVIGPDQPTLASRLAARYSRRLGVVCNPFMDNSLGYDRGFSEYHAEIRDPDAPVATDKAAPRVAARLLPWVDAAPDSSYFAYLHYLEPHRPYDPPEEFVRAATGARARYEFVHQDDRTPRGYRRGTINLYDGNLRYVDHHVGAVVDSLKARGRWDRTIFVLLADHGEAFWQHGRTGHSGVPYEEECRVPLLIRIPGWEPRRVKEPVELVDLLPTLLDLCGVPYDPEEVVGRSLRPYLEGATPPADRWIHSRSNQLADVSYAIRRGPHKWLHRTRNQREEFFDLEVDPGEQQNLLAKPDPPVALAREHADRWAAWLEECRIRGGGPEQIGSDQLAPHLQESLRSLGYTQ